MTEPTTPVAEPNAQPGAAVVEIVERHTGEKYPTVGYSSIICPNLLRINGVAVWASCEHPITVEEFSIGDPNEPFTVTLQLLARALSVGGEPSYMPEAEDRNTNSGAVVEIPGVDLEAFRPGSAVERRHVLLNGKPVFTSGPVIVNELAVGGDAAGVAMVRLSVLCRRLTVDDEPVA